MSIRGACHCGATQFEIDALPATVTSCSCTFCSKRGALWAYFDPQAVRFTSREHVASYAADGPGAPHAHHHCQRCGCTTWSDTPVWENMQMHPTDRRVSINARLLDDVDPTLIPVVTIDGRNLW